RRGARARRAGPSRAPQDLAKAGGREPAAERARARGPRGELLHSRRLERKRVRLLNVGPRQRGGLELRRLHARRGRAAARLLRPRSRCARPERRRALAARACLAALTRARRRALRWPGLALGALPREPAHELGEPAAHRMPGLVAGESLLALELVLFAAHAPLARQRLVALRRIEARQARPGRRGRAREGPGREVLPPPARRQGPSRRVRGQ